MTFNEEEKNVCSGCSPVRPIAVVGGADICSGPDEPFAVAAK